MSVLQKLFQPHRLGVLHQCLRTRVSYEAWGVRACSSGGIHDEEFVQNALLEKENRVNFIRNLERFSVLKESDGKTKEAAVLVPFCVDDGKLSILYTRRTANLKIGAGQVSFPGGKIDDSDDSIAYAALRECEEEIGIPSKDIDIWISVQTTTRVHMMPIHPVIGFIKDYKHTNLTVNANEVQDVFTVPVTRLLNPSYHGYTQFRSGWRMPVYKSSPKNIWGTTAVFTDVVLANAFPRHYKLILKMPK